MGHIPHRGPSAAAGRVFYVPDRDLANPFRRRIVLNTNLAFILCAFLTAFLFTSSTVFAINSPTITHVAGKMVAPDTTMYSNSAAFEIKGNAEADTEIRLFRLETAPACRCNECCVQRYCACCFRPVLTACFTAEMNIMNLTQIINMLKRIIMLSTLSCVNYMLALN